MHTVIKCHSEKKTNRDTQTQACHRRLDICSAFHKLWQRNAIETTLDAYGEFPLNTTLKYKYAFLNYVFIIQFF